MRSLTLLLLTVGPAAFACPMPPPPVEVVANETATIAPDGGIIIRTMRGGSPTGPLVVRADGKTADLERIYLAYDLQVVRPKVRTSKLEVVRGGKVVALQIAASTALAAPKLASVHSTARTSGTPQRAHMYEPTSQVTLEIGSDTPTGAYALVIYKLAPEGTRPIAYGTPDSKHAIKYSTGGKSCYGGFETAYPGDRIAVAWLDIHGRLSAHSATITVAP